MMLHRRIARTLVAAALAAASTAGPAPAQDVTFDSGALEGMTARSLGPAAMSGRISALDAYEGERLTLFVGAASGGLWKSRDGGITFKAIFDKHNPSIGAVRVSPRDTNTVWVGTGEPWTRNSTSVGDGVYKSTNGGDDWQKVGLEKVERVSDIEIDPRNHDVVFVGGLGALWGDSEDRGVYRTRDGGKSWEKVLYVDAGTGCADLAMDPSNPDVVYAAMWTFRRQPWSFVSGGPGSALYKTTDGGATWKKVGGGLPAGLVGRICVAIAPSRPSRVYAVVETRNTALWRSDDSGASWTEMNTSAALGVRPFYFSHMMVDPRDPDRVYKHGLSLAHSEDGGKTFSGGGGAYHSDTHALWVNPRDTDHLVLGTDGGVYISYDRGVVWRFVGTLPVSQFYRVAVDDERPYNVYGGLQDNGSWTAPSRAPGGIGNRHWNNVGGGDGFWTFADPHDNDVVYCEYQGGNLLRFRKSTRETKEIKPFRRSDEPEYRWNWNTPIHMSAATPGTIYFGAQFLFRSRDRGENWERISPDLTTNDPLKQKQDESGGVSIDNTSAEAHCTLYSISESPRNGSVIWVGTDDGNVQLTQDGGKTWTNLRKNITGVPKDATASCVKAGLHDPATAYVTFDAHGVGDMKPYVLVTRDFGRTWTSLVTADLHGFAHTVCEDVVNPRLLFVGTETGLFTSLDGGRSWGQMKGGLPMVPVRDLVIHPREHDLVIATHGRGVYVFDDITPLRGLTPEVAAKDVAFLPSRPAELAIPGSEQRFDGDDQFVADGGGGVWVSYYLKKRPVFGETRLDIFDGAGRLVSSMPGSKRRGINRVMVSTRKAPPKVAPGANLVPSFYSFVGPRLPLGTYTVKLTRGDAVIETPLELKGDARATYTAEDRAQQQKTVNELYDTLGRLTALVDRIAKLRDVARERAKGLPAKDALARKLTAFADALEKQRGELVATREGRFTGEEQLRERLGQLYGAVNGYDGRPTGSQLAYQAVLTAQLDQSEKGFEAFAAKELPALNSTLGKQNLEPIALGDAR